MKKGDLKKWIGWSITLAILITAGFLLSKLDLTTNTSASPLNQLSIRMNSKYWRGLDQNNFSLHYEPLPPNTIIVKIQTTPKSDLTMVREVAKAAQDLVTQYARDEFKLNVTTRVEFESIP